MNIDTCGISIACDMVCMLIKLNTDTEKPQDYVAWTARFPILKAEDKPTVEHMILAAAKDMDRPIEAMELDKVEVVNAPDGTTHVTLWGGCTGGFMHWAISYASML